MSTSASDSLLPTANPSDPRVASIRPINQDRKRLDLSAPTAGPELSVAPPSNHLSRDSALGSCPHGTNALKAVINSLRCSLIEII